MSIFSKVVTLDGEAASGKSSVGSRLSQQLGYSFFDSGSIYRSLSWYLLDRQVEIKPRDVFLALQGFQPSVSSEGAVTVNGTAVNGYLQSNAVNQLTPIIASGFFVRKRIREIQRQFCVDWEGKAVVTGRDVGRDVFPESTMKFYLHATSEVRVMRRYLQKIENGELASYEEILADIRGRDLKDSTRKVSPMGIANDAHVIETYDLGVEQVVAEIYRIIERCNRAIEGGFRRSVES